METNTNEIPATGGAPGKPVKSPTKRPAKSAAPKKAAKAPAKKVAAKTEKPIAAGSGTPLKTLCAKIGMETKLARRKLRAAKFDWHGARERWVFNAKQLEKAKEILAA